MAMRATLQAAKIMTELRGLSPLGVRFCDLNIVEWLKRRDTLEQLDEELFDDTAYMFVAEMLDHAHRGAMLSRARELRKSRKASGKRKKRGAHCDSDNEHEETDDDDNEPTQTENGRYVVRTHTNRYEIGKLISDPSQFVPNLYPLVFGTSAPQAQRPHDKLDYRHAMVVHAGMTMKEFNKCLCRAVLQVDDLRKKCNLEETAHVRIFFIMWGGTFDPRTGKSYNLLARSVRTFNQSQQEKSSGISIEAFSVVELQYDVTEHQHASKCTVVDPTKILALRTIAKHQYRYLHDTDPQARARDLRVGQVVRVERPDKTIDYVVVVPYDSVIAAAGGEEADEDAPAVSTKKVSAVQQGAEGK